MENELKEMIAELLAEVADVDLLDLVYKVLLESAKASQEAPF